MKVIDKKLSIFDNKIFENNKIYKLPKIYILFQIKANLREHKTENMKLGDQGMYVMDMNFRRC